MQYLFTFIQVKYFDQKRVYDAYKKKLENEGFKETNQKDT